jgi:hypothetical protein
MTNTRTWLPLLVFVEPERSDGHGDIEPFHLLALCVELLHHDRRCDALVLADIDEHLF